MDIDSEQQQQQPPPKPSTGHHHHQPQQQPQQHNRYAHLVTSNSNKGQTATTVTRTAGYGAQVSTATVASTKTGASGQQPQVRIQHHKLDGNSINKNKAPPFGASANSGRSNDQRQAYAHYYYNSFSNVDWREQWIIMKDRILEKVDEPQSQRKLILFIVCCALLLDNMLYMVIVPIIPDYLRSIGAWSTYTENAKWIRSNVSGAPKWERVGGRMVYEGEDSAVGFLFASKAIVQLFINPFSGAIIDRIGYEIPMMIGLIVMFFSTMVFACGQTYSILFLARSLQGVGSAFADTSGLAMIADRFTEENERQRALGVALAFISFGCLVAPPFGSVLYEAAGKEVPFIILSLVCLLDGSLLLLVAPPGTFAHMFPSYRMSSPQEMYNRPQAAMTTTTTTTTDAPTSGKQALRNDDDDVDRDQSNQVISTIEPLDPEAAEMQKQKQPKQPSKQNALQRQKSVSRRLSMTKASAGEAPKGTPIYVLFRDPCIACCSGALVVANVSLAFLEPTISIWVKDTMPDIEEWQMGMIWLPAFVPHVLGVYSTVKLADKYPRYQWLIAAIGLVLEGLSCLMVPFCSSFWSLIIPISIICFGLALIDTAILPTLGFLVDTRYVSVYGSIYAIADISYSLSYAIGPIIAGGIVEAIGFTALNFLIAIVTLGYTPILMMLRNIHDYEPFEADNTGLKKKKAKELAPFGQFGRAAISEEVDDDDDEQDLENSDYGQRPAGTQGTAAFAQQQQGSVAAAAVSAGAGGTKYESPRWAATGTGSGQESVVASPLAAQPMKPALAKKSSSSMGERGGARSGWTRDDPKRHSVKIVEGDHRDSEQLQAPEVAPRNPFLAGE